MATKQSGIAKKARGAYHHGDLKLSLKKAALRLVQEKGPRGFSLNEASRLAGVTAAAPYRHFPDKDALLVEIACDGLALMVHDLRHATSRVDGTREKMIEAGMAYLEFSAVHSDFFAVIFSAGLDKSRYPELERAARSAFDVILELALEVEKTPELGVQRATAAWALVHGFAMLTADGALSTALEPKPGFDPLRPILRQFVNQPYG
jgi:AcrR family transcriptional regulator